MRAASNLAARLILNKISPAFQTCVIKSDDDSNSSDDDDDDSAKSELEESTKEEAESVNKVCMVSIERGPMVWCFFFSLCDTP